jgi:predicted DNA-binding transcriptional regulator AlpA
MQTKAVPPTKTLSAHAENSAASDARVYLTTPEAAEYLRLSKQFLEGARYRADGSGPPYIKLERAVRYRRSALDSWMTAHDHSSDKPAGEVL